MAKGNFKQVLEGVIQCQICGFSEAQKFDGVAGEGKLHSICHNKFIKSKEDFGENLLNYNILKETEKKIKEIISSGVLSESGIGVSSYEHFLEMVYATQFTRSLKFWDYFRPHPVFEDYVTLLWNTPTFIKYVRTFLPEALVEEKIKNYIANRKLRETDIFHNEFVFINCVEVVNNIEDKNVEIRDLSFIDTILTVELTEEDEEDEVDDFVTKNDRYAESLTNVFKVLFMNS